MVQLLNWYCGRQSDVMVAMECGAARRGMPTLLPLAATMGTPYIMRSLFRVRWFHAGVAAALLAIAYVFTTAQYLTENVALALIIVLANAAFSVATNWLSERADRTGFW